MDEFGIVTLESSRIRSEVIREEANPERCAKGRLAIVGRVGEPDAWSDVPVIRVDVRGAVVAGGELNQPRLRSRGNEIALCVANTQGRCINVVPKTNVQSELLVDSDVILSIETKEVEAHSRKIDEQVTLDSSAAWAASPARRAYQKVGKRVSSVFSVEVEAAAGIVLRV